ncbi:hypothetical protein [Propionivibrio sp.]|uniref:hypothetical protein n=1 Tax=Propionivibrio sp. TaxID=2212460 RepID=UPI003BF340EF
MNDRTETPKRGRGRPATYSNDAERVRAWRQRQRELIASAKAPAPPVVVEKIVEVERIVEKRVSVPARAGKTVAKTPDASHLFPLLKERFAGPQGEETAKRFRTNAARVATAARDVLSLAQRSGRVPESEDIFLRQVAQFFEQLNGIFQNVQAGAKRAAAKAEADYQARHEADIKATVLKTFGPSPAPADILTMGEALLAFDAAANDWLSKKYRVDRGYFSVVRYVAFERAMQQGNAEKVARELAEARLEIGEKGRRWVDGEQTGYAAGWADFDDYRTNA